jgi:EAL domain-containing protein (putative c-di-GMP-specific phosphodiesterase class I)
MDADKILANLDQIVPFFQPIFSADQHQVIGYEIFGRFEEQSNYTSLESFIHDTTIPEEYRIEVDNYILDKGLKKIKEYGEDFLIFINRDPSLLMFDHGEEFMETLKLHLTLEELPRVVLELSDTIQKMGNVEPLQHVLAYYRTYGIKIAFDHLGEHSQLDKIAQLSPNILKVNVEQIRRSGGDSYQVILFSLSMLARKIGASLLFENIETAFQFRFAWKNGGRYYQGGYLAKPDSLFIDKHLLREKFQQECQNFISYEMKKLKIVYQKTQWFNEELYEFLRLQKRHEPHEEMLSVLASKLENVCFRLYVCDDQGYQTSPNILHKDGKWLSQQQYVNSNWSWRPYFLENIIKMRNEKKGILSDLYTDIETGETIRTFSYPVNNKEYIFLDLSYSYLYENDGLL